MNTAESQKNFKYHVFDVSSASLGRISTKIARVLQGKNSPKFLPNKDNGNRVIVINARDIVVTGGKLEKKMYHRFSGYPGGISSRTMKEQMDFDPREIVKQAVYGMLPKNKLRDKRMKRMTVILDDGKKTSFAKFIS